MTSPATESFCETAPCLPPGQTGPLHQQLREARVDMIFRMGVVAEYRDSDTKHHVYRVSRTCGILARLGGLDHHQVETIRCASPLHDVGKVAIPDAILLKPGYLTAQQRAIVETHTTIGAEILGDPGDELMKAAQEIALCHHERWDGEGYPRRLKGKEIPLSARIVGLADVFDVLLSRRCYKNACSLDMALDIIRQDREKHFDPQIVDLFLQSSSVLETYTRDDV